MPALATLTAATKRYGHVTVFDGFDLEVNAGEITAITGTIGTGKTTLLRCLAGVEPLTSGRLDLTGPVVGLVLTIGGSDPFAIHTPMSGPRLVVSDEPSFVGVAYSPAATDRAIEALRAIAGAGHAVAIATHDPRLLYAADQIIEL